MSVTKLEIWNRTLFKLGERRLSSETDNPPVSNVLNDAYDIVRRSEITKSKWIFALDRRALSPDATAPAFGYSYRYLRPTEALRLIAVSARETLYPETEYIEEGEYILTEESTALYVQYCQDVTDTTKWHPLFADGMSAALALDVAELITGATTKVQMAQQWYDSIMRQARAINAIQKLPVEAPVGSYVTRRNR